MESPLLTVPETMKYLKMGRSRVFQLIKSGELEGIKDGASRRVWKESADAYLERLRRGAEHAHA